MSMSPALAVKSAKRPLDAAASAPEAGRIDVFAHPMIPVFTGIAITVLVAGAVGYGRSAGPVSYTHLTLPTKA